MSGYPYTRGDRLDDRNSYFYSAFGGPDFLRAWEGDREEARAALGPAAPPPAPARSPAPPAEGGFETAALLEHLFASALSGEGELDAPARRRLEVLVQRFEVTKRLHRAYGADHRAVGREEYRDYGLYVRFAELLEHAYRRTGGLARLNALLKCLDTLCSLRRELPAELRGRVARLLDAERDLVGSLARRVEVAW